MLFNYSLTLEIENILIIQASVWLKHYVWLQNHALHISMFEILWQHVEIPDTKKHNNFISLKCLPLHLAHPVIGVYILCQTRRCIAGGTNTILQLQLGVAPWWWIIHVFNTDSNCFPGQMSGYYSPYASGFTAAQMAAAAAAAAAQQSSQVNKKK